MNPMLMAMLLQQQKGGGAAPLGGMFSGSGPQPFRGMSYDRAQGTDSPDINQLAGSVQQPAGAPMSLAPPSPGPMAQSVPMPTPRPGSVPMPTPRPVFEGAQGGLPDYLTKGIDPYSASSYAGNNPFASMFNMFGVG